MFAEMTLKAFYLFSDWHQNPIVFKNRSTTSPRYDPQQCFIFERLAMERGTRWKALDSGHVLQTILRLRPSVSTVDNDVAGSARSHKLYELQQQNLFPGNLRTSVLM